MAAAASAIVKTSIILATSWAPLLSGLLHECTNADDPTCYGGVAAFRALLCHYQQNQQHDNPTIVEEAGTNFTANPDTSSSSAVTVETTPAAHLQLLDKNNAFVHMHPLGLSVNRLILHELMNLPVFASSPSILLQNKLDYDVSSQDLSYLQTRDMPLLLTNVGGES